MSKQLCLSCISSSSSCTEKLSTSHYEQSENSCRNRVYYQRNPHFRRRLGPIRLRIGQNKNNAYLKICASGRKRYPHLREHPKKWLPGLFPLKKWSEKRRKNYPYFLYKDIYLHAPPLHFLFSKISDKHYVKCKCRYTSLKIQKKFWTILVQA